MHFTEGRRPNDTEASPNLSQHRDHAAHKLVVDGAERDAERLPVEQHRFGEVTDESGTGSESIRLDDRISPQTSSADTVEQGPTKLLLRCSLSIGRCSDVCRVEPPEILVDVGT